MILLITAFGWGGGTLGYQINPNLSSMHFPDDTWIFDYDVMYLQCMIFPDLYVLLIWKHLQGIYTV